MTEQSRERDTVSRVVPTRGRARDTEMMGMALDPNDPFDRVLAGDLEARRKQRAEIHLQRYRQGIYTVGALAQMLAEVVEDTEVLS